LRKRRVAAAGVRTELLLGCATAIPLADNTIDTVVMTWMLCSVPHPLVALREMRRVLKPGGKPLFVERGLSPEPQVKRWQHQLTPICCHVAGGCHLDRKMDDLIRSAGFNMIELRMQQTVYGYSLAAIPLGHRRQMRDMRSQDIRRASRGCHRRGIPAARSRARLARCALLRSWVRDRLPAVAV
jgi:SAM-dependent methyltransferase